MSHWKIIPARPDTWYFVTLTIVEWVRIFDDPDCSEIFLASLRFCQKNKDLHIAAYVIMPTHVHMILRSPNLSGVLRDLKAHTSRQLIRQLRKWKKSKALAIFRRAAVFEGKGNAYKIWAEGNHPVALENSDRFMSRLKYVHNNPVRKGYVETPEQWKFSSARNYLSGDQSVLQVECIH